MTQKDKELLLKDLCARVPYGIKINENTQGDFTVIGLTNERVFTTCEVEDYHNDFPIELIKPYLFPLSSMTEEQYDEFIIISGWEGNIENIRRGKFSCIGFIGLDYIYDTIDWLNKNHFDYRNLIENSLAIDATGKDIY